MAKDPFPKFEADESPDYGVDEIYESSDDDYTDYGVDALPYDDGIDAAPEYGVDIAPPRTGPAGRGSRGRK
jgi:hypothetical protein